MTIRRMKAYTGQTGYVYQYYFVGKRPALDGDPEAPATEFVFDVTADRKTTFAVSIFLQPQALEAWARQPRPQPERAGAVRRSQASPDAGLRRNPRHAALRPPLAP